jgi:hypothetical protein
MQNISSPGNLPDYSKRKICDFNNSHGSRESSESPIGTRLLVPSKKGKARLNTDTLSILLSNTLRYNLSIFYCLYLTQASEVAQPPHPPFRGLLLLIRFLVLAGFEIKLLPELTTVSTILYTLFQL